MEATLIKLKRTIRFGFMHHIIGVIWTQLQGSSGANPVRLLRARNNLFKTNIKKATDPEIDQYPEEKAAL